MVHNNHIIHCLFSTFSLLLEAEACTFLQSPSSAVASLETCSDYAKTQLEKGLSCCLYQMCQKSPQVAASRVNILVALMA